MSRYISEDEREDYRQQDAEARYERCYGPLPEVCGSCGYREFDTVDYEYGADADGRRGVRVTGHECARCGAGVLA